MKKNIKLVNGFVLFLSLFSFNTFANDSNLSQEEILKIQDRVNAMSSVQLSERRDELVQESEVLKNEQDTNKNPEKQIKSCS